MGWAAEIGRQGIERGNPHFGPLAHDTRENIKARLPESSVTDLPTIRSSGEGLGAPFLRNRKGRGFVKF